jgi:hypothetical protein
MRNAKPSSDKAPKIIPLSMRRDAGTKTRSKINVRVIIIALDLEDRISQFLIAIAYWSLSGSTVDNHVPRKHLASYTCIGRSVAPLSARFVVMSLLHMFHDRQQRARHAPFYRSVGYAPIGSNFRVRRSASVSDINFACTPVHATQPCPCLSQPMLSIQGGSFVKLKGPPEFQTDPFRYSLQH